MTEQGSLRSRVFIGLAAASLVFAACSGGGGTSAAPSADATTAPSADASVAPSADASAGESAGASAEPSQGGTGSYHIGYSNGGGVGNGFREEQVCTAKAEALASGQVEQLTTIHRNTDAAGQLQDIRDLVAAGVDAIVFNPNDPDALIPALEEAKAAGIVTVSVDAFTNHADSYNLYNNQEEYAYLGAKWLFQQVGEGNVWYTRGIAGHPADTDRHTGFLRALEEHPGITIVPSDEGVHTGWDPAQATTLANDFIASGGYDDVQGIWTSGMDSQVVDAVKAAGKEFVPIVGADLGAFVNQLLTEEGLQGAAVTNTAAVGGAGVALALKLLNGETVTTAPEAPKPNTVLLDPVLADNVSDQGKATLESWQVDGLDPLWPLGLEIEGYTTYTPEQAVACKGPGE